MVLNTSSLTPQQEIIFNKARQGRKYLEQVKQNKKLKITVENKDEHIINLSHCRILNALIKDTPSKEFDGEYDETFNDEVDEQAYHLLLQALLTDGQCNLNQEQIMKCYEPYRNIVFEELRAVGFMSKD